MATYLTANYTLEEFASASHRALLPAESDRARQFAVSLLQPLRREMGFPICIKSFVRTRNVGTHGTGYAIDIGTCPVARAADLERMFLWLATYKPSEFGTLIHERDHLHLTLRGYQGRIGHVLREPTEGNYTLAGVFPFVPMPDTPAGWLAAIALAILLLYAVRQQSR